MIEVVWSISSNCFSEWPSEGLKGFGSDLEMLSEHRVDGKVFQAWRENHFKPFFLLFCQAGDSDKRLPVKVKAQGAPSNSVLGMSAHVSFCDLWVSLSSSCSAAIILPASSIELLGLQVSSPASTQSFHSSDQPLICFFHFSALRCIDVCVVQASTQAGCVPHHSVFSGADGRPQMMLLNSWANDFFQSLCFAKATVECAELR